MNRYQQHILDVNLALASMVKVAPLPVAFKHYGLHKQAIEQARKNGNSNLEIAEKIYSLTGKGPVQRLKDGTMGLNRETAKMYIGIVINHSKS